MPCLETDQSDAWWLWRDGNRDPFMNMAVDETLLRRSAELQRPIVRFYGWDRPAVSIGYVQTIDAAPDGNRIVVRRPTGGGVVVHDADLTYTVVAPESDPLNRLDRLESYHVFHRAVTLALEEFGVSGELSSSEMGAVDRATMDCFSTPTRYDVVANGRKFAGAAQRRTCDGLLHQGSVSLGAVETDREAFIAALTVAFTSEFGVTFAKFEPNPAILSESRELAETKYATDAWNIRRETPRRRS